MRHTLYSRYIVVTPVWIVVIPVWIVVIPVWIAVIRIWLLLIQSDRWRTRARHVVARGSLVRETFLIVLRL